ncbi:MAG: hypothetical protein Q4E42_00880 [Phascolarctobacterium sp.]|nr:hypothetical protein [Phascolarctobacterium sp.]
MIIAVTGYGSTGASAYVDVLREFVGINHINEEFPILHYGDGLLNLRQAIGYGNRLQIQTALLRFKNNIGSKRDTGLNKLTQNKYLELTEKYFNAIANVQWRGSCVDDPVDLLPWYKKEKYKLSREIYKLILPLLGKNKKTAFLQQRYFSTLPLQKFDALTKEYLQNIFMVMGFQQSETVLLEQVFNPCQPLAGMEFFENDVLSLVVDRDPRDVYLLTNVIFPELNKYMPCDKNVKNFVTYYEAVHKDKVNDSRVKYVQYEDLIYNYDTTVQKICGWLPSFSHLNKGKYFKPEYSYNNTQLWKKYPQYSEDIQYIEKELPEMLYDFDGKENNITFQRIETQPFENQEDIK